MTLIAAVHIYGLFLLLDTDECGEGNCDDVRGYCMNTIGSFDCSCRVGYSGDCTKGNCDGMLYIFYNTKCIYIQYLQVVSYK